MIPRRLDGANGLKRRFLVNDDAAPLTPRGDKDELRINNNNQQRYLRCECTVEN